MTRILTHPAPRAAPGQPALGLSLAAALLLMAGPASAVEYHLGDLDITLDNQVSLGATWRASAVDERFIGKSNLQPGLCLRDSGGGDRDAATTAGAGCNSTTNPELNEVYVAQPGSYGINSDNGNLNYAQGDLVAAAAKLTSDLGFAWGRWGGLLRGSYFFDEVNTNFREFHPDQTFQPRETDRPRAAEELVGRDAKLLDAYLYGNFTLPGERPLTVRVGDQVVNWGESTFLILNSINSVNPPSAPVLRSPGFDVKELLVPTGMVYAATNITEDLGIEAFYQYRFEPAIADPAGSFYSTLDPVGAGGAYLMLGFGKTPEDPAQSYDPKDNEDDLTGEFYSSSRTVLRAPDRLPKDGGQYGVKLGWFLSDFNNGTELGFYYLNYHQRLPLFSLIAANATCVAETATNVAEALAGCGLGGDVGRLGLQREPLPVETARYFLEYPEDRRLYGVSFNTTVGAWAWSGEIAYRPDQPLQVHPIDLLFAALQPAFPANDIPICAGTGGSCAPGTPVVAVIPGRRSAIPDFVSTHHRQRPLGVADAGSYIRGFEESRVANLGTTFLRTIGASNWVHADQVIVILEVGATYVFDMPNLDELQFGADGANTHYSEGADGTRGASELGAGCRSLDADVETQTPTAGRACHQNPTAASADSFPTELSWGVRAATVIRYQDVFAGINLEPLLAVFHDVSGIAPGPGGQYVEGRTTAQLGLRWDYLNSWSGELRYTLEAGGGLDNARRDRDVLGLVSRYEF